jgi:hypothetical protein
VTAFAYPYGHFDEPARHRVAELFDVAFTCRSGLNNRHTDLHELRRTVVDVTSPAMFSIIVRSGCNFPERWEALSTEFRHRVLKLSGFRHC